MKWFSKCMVLGMLCLAGPVSALASEGGGLSSELYQAVAGDDAERAEALIEAGADVNRAQRPWELTPLLVAVGVSAELTDLLIGSGADVNAREREGVTVLMKAVHGGDAAIVRRLLEEPDLDLDARGPRGNTALTYAVLYGYPEMVDALVERGVNVNVARADGTTPKTLARHMQGLAEAMPKEAEERRLGIPHARHHKQDDGGHEKHLANGARMVVHEGPHDHHRTRAEATSSYGRVLATLAEAGASIEGLEVVPSRDHGHHH
ncbi:hypothetical protein TVD_07555 [Thioalkalivibrio versutus]|uniref:Uncharacterized protein n=1 Tax=Thioalkalivibrio versutus TaxID=106634 RepID=A0A0G3G5C5_9GAMM|nr:ankyrin repeat domain-containing protein [Thioalkalivibrio versutus]AKJ96453.1 hypothetical protein TVD_07555 [Thioalkalivibrio versutus]